MKNGSREGIISPSYSQKLCHPHGTVEKGLIAAFCQLWHDHPGDYHTYSSNKDVKPLKAVAGTEVI